MGEQKPRFSVIHECVQQSDVLLLHAKCLVVCKLSLVISIPDVFEISDAFPFLNISFSIDIISIFIAFLTCFLLIFPSVSVKASHPGLHDPVD